MNQYRVLLIVSILIGGILSLTGSLPAQSLWSDDGWFSDPYSDYKASRPGDILTVIVSENVSGSGGAQSSGGRTTTLNLAMGTGIFDFIPPAGFSSGSSRSAQRGVSRDFTVGGVITCQVIEVLDNGNLLISGSKEIAINRERETLSIEGVINPRDIRADNTILSTQIVDAVVNLQGTMRPRERTGLMGLLSGIFGSVLDFLF